MSIASLFIIAKIWKQPKCPSMDEWIQRCGTDIYTPYNIMKYSSAIKMNEILTFATGWMNLEGITLSEISQIQKDKYYMISLILESKIYNKAVNITKKVELQIIENKLVFISGEMKGGRGKRGKGD